MHARKHLTKLAFCLFLVMVANITMIACVSAAGFFQDFKQHQEIKKRVKAQEKQEKYDKKNPVNRMPQTTEDYLENATAIEKKNIDIPDPTFPQDPKLKEVPAPRMLAEKYNNPAGERTLNLTDLTKKGQLNTIGVASPRSDMVAYSAVYFDKANLKTSSEIYIIPSKNPGDTLETLKHANVALKDDKPIIQSGMADTYSTKQNILTVIDWSTDGRKLALKEAIGAKDYGTWKTNLLVYDFATKRTSELKVIREVIKYWWLNNHGLQLEDYLWDIKPLGWDASNPDRLVVTAFAYTGEKPKFLGEWSIGYRGDNPQLVSLEKITSSISSNGFSLKFVSSY